MNWGATFAGCDGVNRCNLRIDNHLSSFSAVRVTRITSTTRAALFRRLPASIRARSFWWVRVPIKTVKRQSKAGATFSQIALLKLRMWLYYSQKFLTLC